MENKKIRISEAEYDAVCEYRKSLGKSFVPKEKLKRGKAKSYRTRLSDEEQKIVDKIRNGEPNNTDEEHPTKKIIRNILVIGDLHAPFTKFGYLEFCKSIYYKYKCTDVIFIGDLLDNHVASFHETDPDGMGGREELYKAKEQIAEFYKAFPVARVVIGNHDKLPNRKAFSSGLSSSWIKTIDEVLNVPNWEFEEEFVIDNVLYTHGEGRQARIRVMQELISVVQGHWHAKTYYETFTSERKFVFALQIGCVDGETEYLTPNGWKKINQYSEGDLVCQFNEKDNTAEFAKPISYIKEPCNKMYYLHNEYGLSQKLSDDHNVLYVDRNDVYHKIKMIDLYKKHNRLKKGFEGRFPCLYNIKTNTEIPLTDDELRIMIMFHADGALRYDMKMHGYATFSKKRKIERCEMLLKKANLKYRHKKYSNGTERFTFEPPILTKNFDNKWYSASEHQLKIIAEECLLWDGDQKNRYTSRYKSDCDFIQFVFNSIGFRTHISHDNRDNKSTYSVTKSNIKKYRFLSNTGGKNIDIVDSTDGYKYCFTMPSRNLILRHNNSIFVTGNCGIDRKSYAAAYAKHFQKPQINVGVVLDNGRYAVIEHMKM